jgi:hypothetical protein
MKNLQKIRQQLGIDQLISSIQAETGALCECRERIGKLNESIKEHTGLLDELALPLQKAAAEEGSNAEERKALLEEKKLADDRYQSTLREATQLNTHRDRNSTELQNRETKLSSLKAISRLISATLIASSDGLWEKGEGGE